MHPDLHDIEYDIFQPIAKSSDPAISELAKELGIPQFSKKVDLLAAEAGSQGNNLANWQNRLAELHEEASQILQKLVELKGTKFIENYYH